MNIFDFQKMKAEQKKITMVTCYDYWSACLLSETEVDMLLVGDSAAMIMHGHKSTLPISTEIMKYHTEAVVRGAPSKFIVADLPFLSYRKDLKTNIENIESLMKTGAHAVKLEGAKGNLELIEHIVDSGVPVMGHLGLTPQSLHQLGGMKVQGRDHETFDKIVQDSLALQKSGCFSLVLECVPEKLAHKISAELKIPVIGIGAGLNVDGQVLVLQDLLGFNGGFRPKFLKTYADGHGFFTSAIKQYVDEVRTGAFPTAKESYE